LKKGLCIDALIDWRLFPALRRGVIASIQHIFLSFPSVKRYR